MIAADLDPAPIRLSGARSVWPIVAFVQTVVQERRDVLLSRVDTVLLTGSRLAGARDCCPRRHILPGSDGYTRQPGYPADYRPPTE